MCRLLILPAGLVASGFSEALRRRRSAFEQVVGEALEDGVIDSDERVRIRETQRELGLTKEEAEAILKDRYQRIVPPREPAPRPGACPHCDKPLPHRRASDRE